MRETRDCKTATCPVVTYQLSTPQPYPAPVRTDQACPACGKIGD
jgi:hypothetical protein